MKSLILITLLGLGVSVAHASESHCAISEKTVFNCKAGKKIISVCSVGGEPQYRFGRLGSPELRLPKTPGEAGLVSYGTIMLVGGGGDYLRFVNAKTEYVVYSASIKGGADKEGVAVEKDGKRLANAACSSPATSELGQTFGKSVGADSKDFELP